MEVLIILVVAVGALFIGDRAGKFIADIRDNRRDRLRKE